MIVVKVELWPGGNEKRAVDLGKARIWNDSKLADDGAYEVRLLKGARFASPENVGDVYRKGRVESFPRTDRRFGPWELLALALEAAVGDRIKRLRRVLDAKAAAE